MSEEARWGLDETRDRILEAAWVVFLRDGYKKASMSAVAQGADLSRASLYLYFSKKEELFRAVVRSTFERDLEEARKRSCAVGGFEQRLVGVLEAKFLRHFALLSSSAHAQEILEQNHRLCGDLQREHEEGYLGVLVGLLRVSVERGEISLERMGWDIEAAGAFLMRCAYGLRRAGLGKEDVDAYRVSLESLARLYQEAHRGS